MNQFKLIVIFLFALLVAIFAITNQDTASLTFMGYTILKDVSMVIVVLGCILFGVVITAFLGFLMQSRLKKEIHRLEKVLSSYKNKEEKLQLRIRVLEDKIEESGLELPEQEEKTEE